ncbi:hypothetical protein GCM10010123_07140 [Pilimelia anulata]|uniref:Uncharacterized protein n=1 Tax=Pilimelia anulata TaxID=53371 RepID=A0A8J3B081_9ACTN|nr:hypothetical protein GCM10010123_07140 [Pilimelia anulata]
MRGAGIALCEWRKSDDKESPSVTQCLPMAATRPPSRTVPVGYAEPDTGHSPPRAPGPADATLRRYHCDKSG